MCNGQQMGPMDKMQLLNYGLNPTSQVWHEGMEQWAQAYTVPELMSLLPINSGAQTQPIAGQYGGVPYNQYPGQMSTKSKVAAGVLAILLGGLGVQYFYLGKVGGGFICLLLTIVTCGLWEIVTFIQGIMMLTMTDQQFEMKYVYTDKTFPLF